MFGVHDICVRKVNNKACFILFYRFLVGVYKKKMFVKYIFTNIKTEEVETVYFNNY